MAWKCLKCKVIQKPEEHFNFLSIEIISKRLSLNRELTKGDKKCSKMCENDIYLKRFNYKSVVDGSTCTMKSTAEIFIL